MEFLFRERMYLLKSNGIVKLNFSFGFAIRFAFTSSSSLRTKNWSSPKIIVLLVCILIVTGLPLQALRGTRSWFPFLVWRYLADSLSAPIPQYRFSRSRIPVELSSNPPWVSMTAVRTNLMLVYLEFACDISFSWQHLLSTCGSPMVLYILTFWPLWEPLLP